MSARSACTSVLGFALLWCAVGCAQRATPAGPAAAEQPAPTVGLAPPANAQPPAGGQAAPVPASPSARPATEPGTTKPLRPTPVSPTPGSPLAFDAPFEPSAQQSPRVEVDRFTPDTIHSYRGADDLPRLEAISPVRAVASRMAIAAAALQVRTAPGALVAAWADQLGSFSTGTRGIVVRADADGLAIIDIKLGHDAGSYPFYVTSPERSGLVVFTVNAE